MTRGVHFERGAAGDDPADPRNELRERFQERIGHGRYDDLLPEPVRNVLREGAAIRGMDEELGAIRFALAKLLAEELDASKLAAGVARLSSATVQVLKMDQTLGDETDASLADLLNEILIDLEKESRAKREGLDPKSGEPVPLTYKDLRVLS